MKIYATDVDEEALAESRRAAYSAKQLEDVPDDLRKKYFEPQEQIDAGNRSVLDEIVAAEND